VRKWEDSNQEGKIAYLDVGQIALSLDWRVWYAETNDPDRLGK
jgi:hypothetical protein